MLYIGVLKRFIPFVLTFAAGLFLASFFVPIMPTFPLGHGRSDRRSGRCMEVVDFEKKRLTLEVERLRQENDLLRLVPQRLDMQLEPQNGALRHSRPGDKY